MAAAGHKVTPTVTISDTVIPSKACAGGIKLTACHNRIVLNQTLDERLSICYADLMPQIRVGLFGKSVKGAASA
jgi:hypothetical protein